MADTLAIPEKDRSILRRLAEKQAKIATLPVHQQTIAGWKRLNRLEPEKPMVWINEIPWHEMDVDGKLELQTTHPFSRIQEEQLRRTIYQWDHMPCDMLVESTFYSPLVIHDTGFGLTEAVDIVRTDEANPVVSRHFHIHINGEADLALNNNNVRVGSGGYGYSDALPPPGADPNQVTPADLWGCATAQIFDPVSAEYA